MRSPFISIRSIIIGIFITLIFVSLFQSSRQTRLTLHELNDSFVTVTGSQFQIHGQRFRFVGVNMYDLSANPNTHNYDCGVLYSDADLDSSFSYFQKNNISVVRFWAFQTYAKGASYKDDWSNFRKNGPDWSGIDRAIFYAKKYGIKLIPVLENSSRDCTEGGNHWSAAWFTDEYTHPYGNYPLSYPEWVTLIVSRYKNEPAIMSWMLMNEATDEEPIHTDWKPNTYSQGIYQFAKHMSEVIKLIDHNHLVTLGTIDGNRGGVGGVAYRYIHTLPTIDYIEAHDYGNASQALPGSPTRKNCSQTIACIVHEGVEDIHKPVVIGESGINIIKDDLQSRQVRATEFEKKIEAFFANNGAGYIIWQWDPHSNAGMNFSAGDPLGSVLQKFGFSNTSYVSISNILHSLGLNSRAPNPSVTPTPAPLTRAPKTCYEVNLLPVKDRYAACTELYKQGKNCTWGMHQNADQSNTPGCTIVGTGVSGSLCDWNSTCESNMCDTQTHTCLPEIPPPTLTAIPTQVSRK